jgi:hypothetical protein
MGSAVAALHKSMLAYSGKYRVEGNDFVTTVEVSWNEEWNGSEQRRHFRIDGEKLFITSLDDYGIQPTKKTFAQQHIRPPECGSYFRRQSGISPTTEWSRRRARRWRRKRF